MQQKAMNVEVAVSIQIQVVLAPRHCFFLDIPTSLREKVQKFYP